MAVRKMNEVHDGVTCAVAATSDLIGSKWTALIVHDLSEGPRRFTELEHACPGISPRTLSERLHMLEQQGIVERQSYPESPPRVEYELTGKGNALLPIIEAMRGFGHDWLIDDHDHEHVHRERPVRAARSASARAARAERATVPRLTAQSVLGRLVAIMVSAANPILVPAFGHVRGDHFHAPPLGGRCCSRGPGRRRRRPHNGRGASPTESEAELALSQPTGARKGVENDREQIEKGRAMTRMLGSDAILRSLEAEGVEVMFGIPGGAILPTYDAIARGTTVRHVLARHEQGAGHMAEGYARASGKVGVAIATSGPGATNLVTAIADAWMDSTPLVCITGQVRSNLIGTDAFQETDATGITMPIVKHSWLVQDVRELPQAIKNAFHVARTGRPGPVLVDIAKDAQEAELDFSYPTEVDLPGWRPPSKVHERQVREAAKAIAEAKQPIVYAGGGVLNADASAELLALVEAARLPAVVTLMGKGCLPDSHPLNYGAPGMHGSKYANWALNKSDLIIAVGVRFDDRVTGKVSAFAPGAKVIHFDIDAAEVGKIREADIPVVGPLKLALSQLTRDVKSLEAEKHTDRTAVARAARGVARALPVQVPQGRGRAEAADGDRAAPRPHRQARRRRHLDDRRRPAPDVGDAVPRSARSRARSSPRAASGRWATACPAAVGAKAARPDATVVCIDGDGCFQMTCQELATAALERLPIVVVIINNGWLGMVRQWQELFYAERYAETHLTKQVPDYAQLAEALGCAGFMVDNEDDLDATLEAALDCGRTAVVDARVDPNENCYPMVPAGAASVDIIELPDERRDAPRGSWDEPAHGLRRAREQAGRAGARLADVRAARLQHPEPRGRARPSGPTSRG